MSTRYLNLDPHSPVPLVAQLTSQVTWLIARGEVREGDRLPPIRDLAKALGVNLNTVRAAYKRLEAAGLVTTIRKADASGTAQVCGVLALLLGRDRFAGQPQLRRMMRLVGRESRVLSGDSPFMS